MYRFHPQIDVLKREIKSGKIGKILHMNDRFVFRLTNKHNIRLNKELGGGALLDVGCYCINGARLIFESEPKDAIAWSRIGPDNGVDETTIGVLKFPNQLTLGFECSLLSPYSNSLEVIGTEGVITSNKPFRIGAEESPEIKVWKDHSRSGKPEVIKSRLGDHYKLMVEHFSECVIRDVEPRYPPADALANIRAIEMVQVATRRR